MLMYLSSLLQDLDNYNTVAVTLANKVAANTALTVLQLLQIIPITL